MNKNNTIPDLNNTSLEEIAEWMITLRSQTLTLPEVGITNKIFYDWRKKEIVSPGQLKSESEIYKELRFSFMSSFGYRF